MLKLNRLQTANLLHEFVKFIKYIQDAKKNGSTKLRDISDSKLNSKTEYQNLPQLFLEIDSNDLQSKMLTQN